VILHELEIQLDGFSHFGKRVFICPRAGRYFPGRTQDAAENHFTDSFGYLIKKDDRPFHPHITIANRDLKPGDFEKPGSIFQARPLQKNFAVKQFHCLNL
jgi:2'-5' RNA ligase